MSYHDICVETHYLEYSIYDEKIIFVHRFGIHSKYRETGLSYKVFKELKKMGLPIILECHQHLEDFYKKHKFKRSCIGRDGYREMIWKPKNK